MAVAGPGFLKLGVGVPTPVFGFEDKNLLFGKIFAKNCIKMTE